VTWLAAINETTKEIIVLNTVRWKFFLEIDVDPSRELGQRARIVAPRDQKQPIVTQGYTPDTRQQNGKPANEKFTKKSTQPPTPTKNYQMNRATAQQRQPAEGIPFSALVRPSANNAQTLVWRPRGGHQVVVVPAKERHSDVTELVLFNGSSAMRGKDGVVTSVSKETAMSFGRSHQAAAR